MCFQIYDYMAHYRASPVSRAENAHVIAFVPPNRAKIAATHAYFAIFGKHSFPRANKYGGQICVET